MLCLIIYNVYICRQTCICTYSMYVCVCIYIKVYVYIIYACFFTGSVSLCVCTASESSMCIGSHMRAEAYTLQSNLTYAPINPALNHEILSVVVF